MSVIKVDLEDITNWASIDTSVKNIEKYFEDNVGICE